MSDTNVDTASGDNVRLEMSGGEVIAEMFKRHHVGPMFGMAGFQLLPFYDAVRKLGMTHTLIADERSGAFMADAWSRVTGRPGVCDATLGPGATNLLTALTESLNAGIPIIAMIGDTNRTHAWKNMTQETRQVEMLRPAVKEVIRVEVGERIPEHVRYAYTVATSGRPGPVLLDVPEDICHGVFEFDADDLYVHEATTTVPAVRTRPAVADIQRAAAMLAAAERPIILAGGGVHISGAQDALTALAEAQSIPVAHTLSGKGSIACTEELSLGLFGRYDRTANEVLDSSDCILVVGCKLGEIATKRYTIPRPGIPIIHLDILPEEIGRWAHTDLALWGDARESLNDLREALADSAASARDKRTGYIAELAAGKAKWRTDVDARLTSKEEPVNMARMCHELNNVLPADAILVADGGFAAHWTGLLYDTKRAGRGFIVDRGMASIGYGVAGGIGAQLAAPDRSVFSLTGDGGLNMTLGDLETAARLKVPLTVIVVNNAASGYIKALQHAMFGGRYQSSDLSDLNYATIAEALGCKGIRVTDPDKLADAFREALGEQSRPTVIDVVVTRDAGQMLPGVDNRSAPIKKGDRIA
ncbi:MAG: acetolactate synthase-1/2/3 large subunit [Alphaproteobacteria bacterium]|jgi:acetolactate synthase-1/2/3 large subunit